MNWLGLVLVVAAVAIGGAIGSRLARRKADPNLQAYFDKKRAALQTRLKASEKSENELED